MYNTIGRAIFVIVILFSLTSVCIAGTIVGTINAEGVQSLENILIYIEQVDDNKFEPPQEHAIMDQKDMTFIPHLMPILVGTTVEFHNSDKVLHNVFSPSKAKKFNLGTYPAGVVKSVVFDKIGLVAILCNLHAEMSAFVLPLKNPYFAVTNKDGKFRIPNDKEGEAMAIAKVAKMYENIPPGKYKLLTWHEKLKTGEAEVVVPREGEVEVNLVLTRGKSKEPYKDKGKRR
jgi:plastocyanin